MVCQIMQSIGFLGPAFFLTQLSRVKTPAMAVLCMACSQVFERAIVLLLCIKAMMPFLDLYSCRHKIILLRVQL